MSLRISIALCTYNGIPFLAEQLESLLQQERRPDELVIADDHSDDGTSDLLETFASLAPFPVKLFTNRQRIGIAGNFQMALMKCSGEIIFLADQDDVWKSDKLRVMEDTFLHNPELQALFCNAAMTDAQLHPLGFSLWETVRFNKAEQDQFFKGEAFQVLMKHNVVAGATLSLRRDCLSWVLPGAPGWMHDAWVSTLLAARTKIIPIPRILQSYRQHPTQQLGAAWQDWDYLKREADSHDSHYYLQLHQQLQELASRLTALGDIPPRSLNLVLEKLQHLHLRAHLPATFMKRISPVAMEFCSGNYNKFSLGLKSALKDFLRPG
jgi:glycosyltransferase involved in cell wall biosynthesis